MNESFSTSFKAISTFHPNYIHLIDRLLSIYSLLLIIIGTPANLLCCIIYLQRNNRSNSIKILFGYLAILDTIVPYTFNLNYVFREFNVHLKVTYLNSFPSSRNQSHSQHHDLSSLSSPTIEQIHPIFVKKNLEEHSVFLCRFLSYLGKKNSSEDIHTSTFVHRVSVFSIFYFTNFIMGFSIRFIESLFIN